MPQVLNLLEAPARRDGSWLRTDESGRRIDDRRLDNGHDRNNVRRFLVRATAGCEGMPALVAANLLATGEVRNREGVLAARAADFKWHGKSVAPVKAMSLSPARE